MLLADAFHPIVQSYITQEVNPLTYGDKKERLWKVWKRLYVKVPVHFHMFDFGAQRTRLSKKEPVSSMWRERDFKEPTNFNC